jgi:hypothetical protein
VHNIGAMSLSRLKDILRTQPIKAVHTNYYGKFGLWLENSEERRCSLRLLIRVINSSGVRLSLNKESEFFSPYILVIGRKLYY